MVFSKFFYNKAIDFESSFLSNIGSSNVSLSPTSFSLSFDSSFSYILNVSRDPIGFSSLILFKSFASLIVIALYANLGSKDLRAFFTSFPYGIFSLRVNDSLTMSHNFPLKTGIVSSSLIRKFSNFVVSSSNLDSRISFVPSKWTRRMSHASLSTLVVEISLNCKGSIEDCIQGP